MAKEVDVARGRRLREARQRDGMTHLELAAAAEVAIRTISDIENGYRNANRATWRALEQVLGPIPATPREPSQESAREAG